MWVYLLRDNFDSTNCNTLVCKYEFDAVDFHTNVFPALRQLHVLFFILRLEKEWWPAPSFDPRAIELGIRVVFYRFITLLSVFCSLYVSQNVLPRSPVGVFLSVLILPLDCSCTFGGEPPFSLSSSPSSSKVATDSEEIVA